jgi:cytochrome P450
MAEPDPIGMPFGEADPALAAAPQGAYRALREEAPVLRSDTGVIVSRHEDVMFALRHPDLFSSNMDAIDIGNVRPLIPLQVDPPDHVKYRRLLDPLFAPKAVATLEPDVRRLVNDLIDEFVERGEVEFNAAFAIPLPCTVFLRLLGLPYDDLELFLRFKDDIIRPGFEDDVEQAKRVQRATGQEIYAYFERVIAERRAEPRDDLVTRFLHAEIDGHRLSDHDILDICYLFLLAGLDTVTASLGCAVSYLAQHPERRDVLVADPSLVPGAVEELLRWETPVPGVPRIATRDVEIGGETIREGEHVMCLIGAADLDPAEFPEPDAIDFSRSGNRHLAFGGGLHRCLGSHLARLEMRVALEELHRRIPDYVLAEGETPRYTMGIRAVDYLPLTFTPQSRR